MNVIEATGLGKRYWTTWALRDCTLAVPPGRVAALFGPNGAGKTTLMHLAVGLTAPTEGRVTVLGGRPAGSPEALNRVGVRGPGRAAVPAPAGQGHDAPGEEPERLSWANRGHPRCPVPSPRVRTPSRGWP
jgi:energy-coupling factor transporter ATP-binding protein EcfA2